MNSEFIVTSWFQPFSIKNFDFQMELTCGINTGEIDILAWDNTSGRLALGNITITIWYDTTEKFLEGFGRVTSTFVVFVFPLTTKWDEFFSDHWDELGSILPVTDILKMGYQNVRGGVFGESGEF